MVAVLKHRATQFVLLTMLCVIGMAPIAGATAGWCQIYDPSTDDWCTIKVFKPRKLTNRVKSSAVVTCKKKTRIRMDVGIWKQLEFGGEIEVAGRLGDTGELHPANYLAVTAKTKKCKYGTRFHYGSVVNVWLGNAKRPTKTVFTELTNLKCNL